MRPIFTFPLALFLLTACSANTPAPQVTVTFEVTVTLSPPTQTPASTFTPAPHIEMRPLPDAPHDIPAISADELQKLYPGGMPEIISAYNKLALEKAQEKEWTGARATKFIIWKTGANNGGIITLFMDLDKKIEKATEVPVEYPGVSIINKGDGELTGGEFLFPDIVPDLEKKWFGGIDVLLVNSIIHTGYKDENGKFIDLAFTGFTDAGFVNGNGGYQKTFYIMQDCFGANRTQTAMPIFNFGSHYDDSLRAALPTYAAEQKISFTSDGETKDITLGEAWAKIGTDFRSAKTAQDLQKIQAMLDQVVMPMMSVDNGGFRLQK